LSEKSEAILIELLTARKRDGVRVGSLTPLALIFQRDGEAIEQNHIRRIFKRVLTKAGIREMRIHDIRHTYASLLLSQGVSQGEGPVYVKEQLCHQSIQVTVDVYGHLIPGANRGAVNSLDSPQPVETYPQPGKIEKP
jgi:integrase